MELPHFTLLDREVPEDSHIIQVIAIDIGYTPELDDNFIFLKTPSGKAYGNQAGVPVNFFFLDSM